ncbi:MAG: ABC transporter substrate-binding protein [Desulfobacteraceae bacterium]|nr:ABC transporter substrate-binding protein [Desulfobacteraceae bacterium]
MIIRFIYKFFFLICLIIVSCAPKPLISTVQPGDPDPNAPGEPLFRTAESFYAQKAWSQAMAGFANYIAQYPQGPRVDQANWKIGSIYLIQGERDAATAFFWRLLNEHPDSKFKKQTQLALLDIYLDNEQFAEAEAMADIVMSEEVPENMRQKFYDRLSSIYRATGKIGKLLNVEYKLFQFSSDEERLARFSQVNATINQLRLEDIEDVWDGIKEDEIRSLLMYRYAVVLTEGGKYDNALDIITVFLESYPNHINAGKAREFAVKLTRYLSFAPYTVGVLLPLTGPYELYGKRALNGIELALGTSKGGETPVPIRLVIKDTASNPSRSVQLVRELAAAKVGAIIGPIITAAEAAREAQRLHIPMLTITQKADVPLIGNYIFRHFITPKNQVKTLADYFINSLGLNEFAILYPNEPYGKRFMKLFWDEIAHQGGHVVGIEAYNPQNTDFAEPIRKLVGLNYKFPKDLQTASVVRVRDDPYVDKMIKSKNRLERVLPDPVGRLTGLYFQQPDQDRTRGPAIGRSRSSGSQEPAVDFDVLFIPDAPKKAGLIIPQLAYHDIRDIYLAGTNLWHSKKLIDMSNDYIDHAILADGFFKDSKSPIIRKFIETYQQVYDQEPGIIEAYAFDTAKLLFGIFAQPDIKLRNSFRDALSQTHFQEGVTGETLFTDTGEAIKYLTLLQVKQGRFVELSQP